MKLSLILLSLSLIFFAISQKSFGKQQMKDAEPQFLMVIDGVYRAGFPTSSNVELISLDPEVEVPECLQNLNDHPRRLHWSCAATLLQGMYEKISCWDKFQFELARAEGLPHLCGGYDYDEGLLDDCYRYNPGRT